MSNQLRGAEIFVKALADEGVEFLFGYPGGAVLHLYDEIFKQDTIKHVLVRHEQGATHAADGYARATGKPGVVLVTSGPGATNAVTGIATAHMDSIPMVVFTGQVSTALIGNDAFQEVDSVGITRPCVKHNFLVQRVEDLAIIIKKDSWLEKCEPPCSNMDLEEKLRRTNSALVSVRKLMVWWHGLSVIEKRIPSNASNLILTMEQIIMNEAGRVMVQSQSKSDAAREGEEPDAKQ